MNLSSYGYGSSISETLDIVETGLRRLGITNVGINTTALRRSTVARFIRVQEDRKAARTLTQSELQQIKELSSLDLNQAEIARRIGRSQATISKTLKRLGIPTRSQARTA